MAKATRSRVLAASPDEVWRTIGDPYSQARWWPRVARVEGVDEHGFTQLMRTEKGHAVRADFTWLERTEGRAIGWRQETAGTPFERLMQWATTQVTVEPADGGTKVTIRITQKLRGFARFGSLLVGGATKRILDEALDGLEQIHGRG